MIRRIAAIVIAATVAAAAAPPPPGSAPPGVEILEDGSLVHRPSGLRLPRTIRGPRHTYNPVVREIGQDRVSVEYGAIMLKVGPVERAVDPGLGIVPAGTLRDPDPPSLPSLLFWGEGAAPVTYSFAHDPKGSETKDWLDFVVIAQGWQIDLTAIYDPEDRDTVVLTAEAVWATLASANETVRK